LLGWAAAAEAEYVGCSAYEVARGEEDEGEEWQGAQGADDVQQAEVRQLRGSLVSKQQQANTEILSEAQNDGENGQSNGDGKYGDSSLRSE
jgi:hypothetical protein